MHTPVAVTERAMAVVAAEGIDGTIALGGGSTTGLGKAIALRTDLPQLVIPTTYAGSEMTDILGETADGGKTTIRDPKVVPETVLYDVALTIGLPVAVSVTSGERHRPCRGPPRRRQSVASLMAEESTALRRRPPGRPRSSNIIARSDALYGARLPGASSARPPWPSYKLRYVFGGSFGLPTRRPTRSSSPRGRLQCRPCAHRHGPIGHALGRTDVAAAPSTSPPTPARRPPATRHAGGARPRRRSPPPQPLSQSAADRARCRPRAPRRRLARPPPARQRRLAQRSGGTTSTVRRGGQITTPRPARRRRPRVPQARKRS